MTVKPIPEGYRSITPYLTVRDPQRELDFLQRAFGATVILALKKPDGSVGHCELRIGDSPVMLGRAAGGTQSAQVYHYVDDCDATYRTALAAGGTSLHAPRTHPYGDRSAGITDPEGIVWWIATHVEDVSGAEIRRRMGSPA